MYVTTPEICGNFSRIIYVCIINPPQKGAAFQVDRN